MHPVRTLLSWLLAAAACGLTVVTLAATWMDREVMDASRWTDTSVQVLRDPEVQVLTASFLADQLVAQQETVDLVREALPPALQRFSGTVTVALGQAAERAAVEALRERALEDLWAVASRDTHRQFTQWIDTAPSSADRADDRGRGADRGDARTAVSLDLQPILERLARRIGFSDETITRASAASGDATVPLVRTGQFAETRRDAHRLERAASLTLPLAAIVAALSILVAHRRRWALVRLGLAAVVAGLVVAVGATELRAHLVDGLVEGGAARPVARTILALTAPDLVRSGWLTAVAGGLVALLAFATRPGRPQPRHR